jgi:hypothetical protein
VPAVSPGQAVVQYLVEGGAAAFEQEEPGVEKGVQAEPLAEAGPGGQAFGGHDATPLAQALPKQWPCSC